MTLTHQQRTDALASIGESAEQHEDRYVANRIVALSLNGAIAGLRQEAILLRSRVTEALNKDRVDYDWCERQLGRAAAFDAEANRLDNNRPAGAAGLAS